jgi:hypothetical protein
MSRVIETTEATIRAFRRVKCFHVAPVTGMFLTALQASKQFSDTLTANMFLNLSIKLYIKLIA